jgi:hypothetical protein
MSTIISSEGIPIYQGGNAGIVIPPSGGGSVFNPNDEINADISRFYLRGGQGAQFVGAGGLTLTGWTVNNADANNTPDAASIYNLYRRLVTAFNTNSSWGARTTTTIAPVKIGQNGVGDFSIVLDFGRLPNQLWDGQFFTGASSGSLSAPIESHATDYVGFMRPSTLGNYHTAIRVNSGSPVLVDTGVGLGANDGSVVYRFVVSSNNGQVTFTILSYNGTTSRFDVVEYTSTVTSGLPTVTLTPIFGGTAAQSLSVGVQRFVGWARL